MDYRTVALEEIDRRLFHAFIRRQDVTKCWRKEDGDWVIRDIAFIDDWSEVDYAYLVACLRRTLEGGGVLFGAFEDGALKGFASVEGRPLGSRADMLDLSSLHVSRDRRGRGAGRRLFGLAADWARAHGARKLYISAHSAVETQAFYRAMGCVEAEEYDPEHTAKEPCDCQLEYRLATF